MNIVYVEAVQSYGGAQIATVNLLSKLKDAGHTVSVIDCYGSCGAYVLALAERNIPLKILQPRTDGFVIRKYGSRVRNAFRLLSYVFHWYKLRKLMCETLKKLRPSHVVCYNHKSLSLLERGVGYEIIYYAHGWYMPSQVTRSMRYLIRNRTDKIIAISQATRQVLYAGGLAPLERIYVVHNAIDVSDLPKEVAVIPNSEGKFKVLISGGFLADKGLHIAVEVARILKERGFPFKLIITGIIYKGPESAIYHQRIVDLIKSYNLCKDVELVVGKSNVIDYFRASDCLIHPSSTEGLPLVVMEAMALGLPVVVNAVGGVVDMVLDGFTGVIAPHNDVVFYADSIERLATDDKYRNLLTTNASALITHSYNESVQLHNFELALNN